jgi:hypothetical protein
MYGTKVVPTNTTPDEFQVMYNKFTSLTDDQKRVRGHSAPWMFAQNVKSALFYTPNDTNEYVI